MNKYLKKNKITKYEYLELASQRKATAALERHGSALYGLYSYDHELLYLGYASNLATRIGSHFRSNTNTKYFSNHIKYARYTYDLEKIRSAYNQIIQTKFPHIEIYDIEFFAIKLLNPIYNKEKAEHLIFREV